MGLFSWLNKNKKEEVVLPPFDFSTIGVDIHSHLLPGIDDGAQSLDHSIGMILKFREMGYKKLITTPHVMQDCYNNSPEIILQKLEEVRTELARIGVSDIIIEASAEYNVEDSLFPKVLENGLLPFSSGHVLFEYSFFCKPFQTEKLIFDLKVNNYIPVIAHYERYSYYFNQPEMMQSYRDNGVLIQLNLLSIIGHYGPDVQQQAFFMIDNGFVDFVASDCHRIEHLDALQRFSDHAYFHKLSDLNLKNRSLL